MATQLERVACYACNECLLYKNLKTHFLRHHPGIKMKYKSILNRNVLDLFQNAENAPLKTQKTVESIRSVPESNQSLKDLTETTPLKKQKTVESVRSIPESDQSLKELTETITSKCILRY